MIKSKFTVPVLALLATLCGCASARAPVDTNAMAHRLAGAPPWVLGDCRTYFKAGTPVLCAVGSVSGTRDPSMARKGATARARTELSSTLYTTVKALIEDYQANVSASGGAGRSMMDEDRIESASRQLSHSTLSGSQINATWISPTDDYFVLLSMDAESFRSSLQQMRSIDEGLRRAISERADGAFQKLDRYSDGQ